MNLFRKTSTKDLFGYITVALLIFVVIGLAAVCFDSAKMPEDTTNPTASQPVSQTTAAPVTQPTTVPTTVITTVSTTVPTTTQLNPQPDTTVPTTQPTTSVQQLGKAEILAKVRDGVNALKSDTATFSAKKTQTISVTIDDLSLPALLPLVNGIITRITGDPEYSEFEFVNGKGYDPEDKKETTSMEVIPPTLAYFTLTDINGISEAKTEETAKGIKYTIRLVPEKATIENTKPPYHLAACDVFDFSLFDLPVGEITRADLDYQGAIISVTYNAEGQVVEYYENMAIQGYGEATGLGYTGNGTLSGVVEELWEITWKN